MCVCALQFSLVFRFLLLCWFVCLLLFLSFRNFNLPQHSTKSLLLRLWLCNDFLHFSIYLHFYIFFCSGNIFFLFSIVVVTVLLNSFLYAYALLLFVLLPFSVEKICNFICSPFFAQILIFTSTDSAVLWEWENNKKKNITIWKKYIGSVQKTKD